MIAFGRARAALFLRAWGGAIVALTIVYVTAVSWVAWFLADAAWTTAPLSASRTPLHSAVFTGATATAIALTTLFGLAIGAAAGRGTWMGPDPTLVLPLTPAARWIADWAAAVAAVAVIALGALPLDVALFELGGIGPEHAVRAFVAQVSALGLAPLGGVVVARLAR